MVALTVPQGQAGAPKRTGDESYEIELRDEPRPSQLGEAEAKCKGGDMLASRCGGGEPGNHSKELQKLRNRPQIYFAKGHHAKGILEGIDFYDFLGEIRIPNREQFSYDESAQTVSA